MSKLQFPETGKEQQVILQALQDMQANDLPWQTGKVMAYVYGTEPSAMDMAAEAYKSFLAPNGLDPTSFPSLLQLEREVIGMVADLLNGGPEAAGNCTSGGTESVILAVKTARDHARATKPHITKPNIVIPETAHPCFHKAGHYLDVEVITTSVNRETFRADLDAMKEAMNDQTIMLVGSAPSYAHGVIDPITEIAALAKENNLLCHVDCCVGGMYLPFAEMLGYDIPPFDFRVDGVTSMSCDLHKYGYVPKGCSSVVYRNKELRQYQFFTCSAWPGYTIINPTVLSSKTGGPMAGAWAMFNHFGKEGYKKAVKACQEATEQAIKEIADIPELELLGKPEIALVAFKSVDEEVSVFEIADIVNANGWYIQVQLASPASPEALHLSITHFNAEHIPALMEEIKKAIHQIKHGEKQNDPLAEMLKAVDPQMLQMMLANFDPSMLEQLDGLMGTEDNGVPQNMKVINNILNGLSVEQREMLLTAFVNRMFTTPA